MGLQKLDKKVMMWETKIDEFPLKGSLTSRREMVGPQVTIFGQGIVTTPSWARGGIIPCGVIARAIIKKGYKTKHRHGRKDLDTDGSVSKRTSGQQVY